jgi:hypothetical protein
VPIHLLAKKDKKLRVEASTQGSFHAVNMDAKRVQSYGEAA